MKKSFPVLLIGLWYGNPVQAELRLAEPRVDAGEVRAGVQLTRTFALINNGPETVEILEAVGSCGCLKPGVEPKIILAKAVGTLILSVNTLGQGAGQHTWSARVRYRVGGKVHELAVAVCARVVTEVTVQPATLTLVAHGAMTQTVTLTDLRDQALKITAVDVSTPGMKARLLSQGRGVGGPWTGKIQLDVAADIPPGRRVATLSIYTDDPVYRHLQVPVTLVMQAARWVSASPDQVELSGRPGQTPSALVRLRTRADQAIRIAKVEAGDPALVCKWAAGPGRDATLRLQLDPSQWTGGDLETRVQVHLSRPAGEIVIIPVKIRSP